MPRIMILIFMVSLWLNITGHVFPERDREYWSKYSMDLPVNKKISYLIKPEWRMKDKMTDRYLFKIEQSVAFKLNRHLELAPCYVRQKSESIGKADMSDSAYLDMTGKVFLKEHLDFKIINRLRYQYNFDNKLTVWRNSTKINRTFKPGKFEISLFIEDEMFYNTNLDKVNQNEASTGICLALNKHASVSMFYLLVTKSKGNDWIHADVLATSVSIKL